MSVDPVGEGSVAAGTFHPAQKGGASMEDEIMDTRWRTPSVFCRSGVTMTAILIFDVIFECVEQGFTQDFILISKKGGIAPARRPFFPCGFNVLDGDFCEAGRGHEKYPEMFPHTSPQSA